MSGPRLLFLYPPLYQTLRASEAQTTLRTFPKPKLHLSRKRFHDTVRRKEETYVQRYGPAAEHLPPPISSGDGGKKLPVMSEAASSKPAARKLVETKAEVASQRQTTKAPRETGQNLDSTSKDPTSSLDESPNSAELNAKASKMQEVADSNSQDRTNKPLEKVLHMEAPTSTKAEEHKAPHLHAPPYIHHFDTFTLVKDLQKGNFTPDQSITIMKAIRSLMGINLDVAKEGLISKSDVENETYLFRAACSELRTEILHARRASSEKMRTERAHLQHEVDILNQKLTQDSLNLKDELRGMFDDRKMSVRMEQRAIESAVQELNYKITVALNSDSRGEVEGLRWVLTRRAALAIAGMAFLILGSLRYTTYMIHLQDEERRRSFPPPSTSPSTSSGSSSGSGPGGTFTVPSRDTGTQTQTGEANALLAAGLEEGEGVEYVSLG